MSYDLFVFAGEISGDIHGEQLIKSLLSKHPKLKIAGVGGPKMRNAGLNCFMKMEEFEVMGFIDILPSLPRLIKHFLKIKKEILLRRPKAVIFIDYPGFNLRLAKTLKKINLQQKEFIISVLPFGLGAKTASQKWRKL